MLPAVVDCSPFVNDWRCLLRRVRGFLVGLCRLVFGGRCLLCVLCDVRCLLFVVCCNLFVACWLMAADVLVLLDVL